MTKTIELTLEKECDLKPGKYNLLKIDGKKLTVEAIGEETPTATDKEQIIAKILADAVQDPERPRMKKRKISEVLAGYKGGLFKDAQEVDDYIREGREEWDEHDKKIEQLQEECWRQKKGEAKHEQKI